MIVTQALLPVIKGGAMSVTPNQIVLYSIYPQDGIITREIWGLPTVKLHQLPVSMDKAGSGVVQIVV